jgi:hypothetical protein
MDKGFIFNPMFQRIKPYVPDILLLLLAAVTAHLTCRQVFLKNPRTGNFDYHLHDTYFTLAPWTVQLPLFMLLAFLFFYIRSLQHRFKKDYINRVVLLTGITVIGHFAFYSTEMLGSAIGQGFSLYPMSGALEPAPQPQPDSYIRAIPRIVNAIQAMITAGLLILSYFWGRSHKRR